MSRRTRALRYGASIAVALVGVGCGALIRGTAGGTAATVLVGLGLVGLVSLVFYEVGLTEDHDHARAPVDPGPPGEDPGPPGEADHLGSSGRAQPGRSHEPGRLRPPERRRGQRRRLD